MSSQLQIKMDDIWQNIEADDFEFWKSLGYEIRAIKLVVVAQSPVTEKLIYQYRWIKNSITEWTEQTKKSHDLCVQQLLEGSRNDIEVRVVSLTQIGDIIKCKTPVDIKPPPQKTA